MRLFVSIDFAEHTREKIHSLIPEQKGWKKTSMQQLHLTLVFLGDCSAKEKEEIHQKLSEVEFAPFEIVIEGLGAFPNQASPRIIWAGVRQNNSLMDLQARISDQLKNHIKSNHTGSYIPHITVARKKSRKSINHIIQKNLNEETDPLTTEVKSFQLKKSILSSGGSEHQILHSYF